MSTQVDPSLPDGIKISSEGVITGSVVDNFDSVTFIIFDSLTFNKYQNNLYTIKNTIDCFTSFLIYIV